MNKKNQWVSVTYTASRATRYRRQPPGGKIKFMNALKQARRLAGCDQEELWFYQHDRELIEKMKEKGLRVIEGGKSASPSGKDPDQRDPGQRPPLKKAA